MVRRQRIDHKGVLVFAYVCVMERGCCGLFGYVDIYRDWLIDRSRHVEVYFLSFRLSSTSVTNVWKILRASVDDLTAAGGRSLILKLLVTSGFSSNCALNFLSAERSNLYMSVLWLRRKSFSHLQLDSLISCHVEIWFKSYIFSMEVENSRKANAKHIPIIGHKVEHAIIVWRSRDGPWVVIEISNSFQPFWFGWEWHFDCHQEWLVERSCLIDIGRSWLMIGTAGSGRQIIWGSGHGDNMSASLGAWASLC